MARKKLHKHFNEVPKFLTTDIKGSCIIYELKSEIRSMGSIEALFSAVKLVRYDGVDSVTEDAVGSNAKSIFLELRTGSLLPEFHEDMELTWYEKESDGTSEITLEDIITMCVI